MHQMTHEPNFLYFYFYSLNSNRRILPVADVRRLQWHRRATMLRDSAVNYMIHQQLTRGLR